MRRGLFWVGVLVGVVLLAGGLVVAALGITATQSPSAVVRAYFAALARGDAARALAYGRVPFGPHTLLTADVLREQQRIAPMRDVSIVSTEQHGSHASVQVKYTLAFHGGEVPVTARVPLHSHSGEWRLDYAAIPTELSPSGGRQRMTLLGDRIPTGTVLMFPGALPIRVDTPYLELDGSQDNVTFDALSTTEVELTVSDAGRAAMLRAVRAGLTRCVSGRADPACPLPNERYVPGSIRGSLAGVRATQVELVAADPVGALRFTGSATVVGSWRRLDFHNVQVTGHGHISLDITADAYATAPLQLSWEAA